MPDSSEASTSALPPHRQTSDATTAGPSSYRPNPAFSFPAAFQPSIIRSFQKDSYYLSLLQTQLSEVARILFGSRFLQTNSEKVTLLAGLAYYGFATWEGAQTLGEEYVGARMVSGSSRRGLGARYVQRRKRMAFILSQILAPFLISRVYARLRRAIRTSDAMRSQALQRTTMRWRALNGSNDTTSQPSATRFDRLVKSFAEKLPSLEDLNKADGWIAYATAFHLMLFYLGGKYYKVGQRLVGVRYISIHPAPAGQEPPSYEILGVLLGIQLGVKLALSLNRFLHKRAIQQEQGQEGSSATQRSSSSDEEPIVDIDGREWTHRSTPAKPLHLDEQVGEGENQDFSELPPPGPRVPLVYAASTGSLMLSTSTPASSEDISAAQLRTAPLESIASSVLKCTLCMDTRTPERGTSCVTECGHLFDWHCIMNWLKEKRECPLCRQEVSSNRVIPM